MEVISTELYPRHLPNEPLPKARTITLVGQVLSLDEGARVVTIMTQPESNQSFKIRINKGLSHYSAINGVRLAEDCQVH